MAVYVGMEYGGGVSTILFVNQILFLEALLPSPSHHTREGAAEGRSRPTRQEQPEPGDDRRYPKSQICRQQRCQILQDVLPTVMHACLGLGSLESAATLLAALVVVIENIRELI